MRLGFASLVALLLVVVVGPVSARAGATLKAADLVVVGFHSDNVATSTRAFALLALADIPVGSVVFLTDRGIYSSTTPPTFTDANGDGTVRWVTTAISKGTIIRFLNNVGVNPYVAFNGTSYGTITTLDTTAKRFNLSLDGDQILIFQTSDDTASGSIQRLTSAGGTESAFVYAFNEDHNAGLGAVNDVDGWWQNPASVTQANAATQSRLPAGSTAVNSSDGTGNAGTADAFGRLGSSLASVEYENWVYSGPTTSATKTGWLQRIHTVANWTGNDTGLSLTSGSLASDFTVTLPAAVVSSVGATTANGSYGAGSNLRITVTFDQSVSVSGTPRLQLNSGDSVFADYVSGTGTATLEFSYTVASGQSSSDLDYTSTSALTTNGGSITAAGQDANLTLPTPGASGSLGANKNLIIDTTPPGVSLGAPSTSLTTGGPVSWTVTYSDADSVSLVANQVTVHSTGTADAGIVGVSGAGATRTVTLQSITGDGTLAISLAAGTASDLAGNTAPGTDTSTAVTVDNLPPTLSIGAPSLSASAGADVTYVITYSGAAAVTLQAADVTLNQTGDASANVAVTGSGTASRTITLSGITGNGTLGITLAAGTATDAAGNSAASAGPSATFVVDTANDSPAITGTEAAQAVDDDDTLAPFDGVTVADPDLPAQTLSVSVRLDTAAKGGFTTLNGFTDEGGGEYRFEGTATAATTAIRGLVFSPTPNRVPVGSTETTTFTIVADDGNGGSDTNTTTTVVSASVNDAPVAGNDTLRRFAHQGAKISVAELLANDVEADDGDTLTVSLPSGTTVNGATVALIGRWVVFGDAVSDAEDSFTYTVTDGHGGTDTGTVTVTVQDNLSESANLVSISLDGSDVVLRFHGIPGLTYEVQYTTSLDPANWVTLTAVAPGSEGLIEYRDVSPPPPSRIYRTAIP